jgi:hypothetical protein
MANKNPFHASGRATPDPCLLPVSQVICQTLLTPIKA